MLDAFEAQIAQSFRLRPLIRDLNNESNKKQDRTKERTKCLSGEVWRKREALWEAQDRIQSLMLAVAGLLSVPVPVLYGDQQRCFLYSVESAVAKFRSDLKQALEERDAALAANAELQQELEEKEGANQALQAELEEARAEAKRAEEEQRSAAARAQHWRANYNDELREGNEAREELATSRAELEKTRGERDRLRQEGAQKDQELKEARTEQDRLKRESAAAAKELKVALALLEKERTRANNECRRAVELELLS